MSDLWSTITNAPSFAFWISVLFTAMVAWFFKAIAEKDGLTLFSVPIVLFCCLTAFHLYQLWPFELLQGQKANIVAAIAGGCLVAVLFLIFVSWLMSVYSDYSSRRRRDKLVTISRGR